ncbi:tetratricopeptide repeat protein [Nannocystis pusilla]|uniref:tetratricopeptide repeat protein n=1 Tax=Nannocystis pusilla TaxID=889268 RepID=UPI001CCCD2A2
MRTRSFAAALVGLVCGCGGASREADRPACEAAGAELEATWNEGAQGRVRQAFVAAGGQDAGATADKVLPWVEEQARAWQTASVDVCAKAEWSAELRGRAEWCLADRRSELEVLVEEFAQADATVVQTAELPASGLRPIGPCLDEAWLGRQPATPSDGHAALRTARAELARARRLHLAGQSVKALEKATAVRAQVEQTLAWPPLWAAARGFEGVLLAASGSYADGEAACVAAYHAAVSAEAWDVAADVASDLIDVVGFARGRGEDGRAWAGRAEQAIARAGDRLGLREAGRLINLGIVELAEGSVAAAQAQFERALALRTSALGPEHRAVASILGNLAQARRRAGALPEAAELLARALQIEERMLGPEHPRVATTLGALAGVRQAEGSPAEARALLERAAAIREKALGPDHPDLARTLGNLAMVEKALGAHATAQGLLERALAIQEKSLGGEDREVAVTLGYLAAVHVAERRPLVAVPLLERQVARLAGKPGEPAARFELARAVVGQDRARALAEAKKAREGFVAAEQRESVAAVDAWLVEQGPT